MKCHADNIKSDTDKTISKNWISEEASCDISRRLKQPDISVEKVPNSLDFFEMIVLGALI